MKTSVNVTTRSILLRSWLGIYVLWLPPSFRGRIGLQKHSPLWRVWVQELVSTVKTILPRPMCSCGVGSEYSYEASVSKCQFIGDSAQDRRACGMDHMPAETCSPMLSVGDEARANGIRNTFEWGGGWGRKGAFRQVSRFNTSLDGPRIRRTEATRHQGIREP